MSDKDEHEWTGHNFYALQQWAGERPGNYHIDPGYVRKGFGSKAYMWDALVRKWILLRPGDVLSKRPDGIIDLIRDRAA